MLWKVWLVGFVPTITLLMILDPAVVSIGFGLALLVICIGMTFVAGLLMRRFGIIGDHRRGSA